MTHELKIEPKWFEDVVSRKKTFEIRFNDRDFKVGDTLLLREYNPALKADARYTGRKCAVRVRYIYDGNIGLLNGYVVMGFDYEARWG